VTSAPLMLNLIHDDGFLFNNGYSFTSRYSGEADYFSESSGKMHSGVIWETNFVPDVRSLKLHEFKERGAGGSNMMLELSNNTMASHISEFPVGTYKKAHRHGPAAHVVLLNGEGYSLLWLEGQPMTTVPWRSGSMFVPPGRWFHQHFNVGATPARYLALRWNSRKNSMGGANRSTEDVKSGGDQIEYDDQDPAIDRLYGEECRKRGVTPKMAAFFKKK